MSYINLISSFFITGVSLFALKPLAGKVGLMDIPGGRKTHSSATPMVGGLGIYFGTLIMCLMTPAVSAEFWGLLLISGFVLVIGLFDDAKELRVSWRMVFHAVAALAMIYAFDVRLLSFGNLLGGGEINLGLASVPVTVFATLGVINAINMSDGLDGLSGGMVATSLLFLAIVSLSHGNAESFGLIVVLSCSVLAFLTLNFRRPWNKKALVYLGDAGSTMLGFMLAWLLIYSTQTNPLTAVTASIPPVYALWFLAIPLFDTVSLLVKRPLKGLSPFAAGRDHLHHKLLEKGMTSEQVVVTLIGVSLIFGVVGLIGLYNGVSELLMFVGFLALFALYNLFISSMERTG